MKNKYLIILILAFLVGCEVNIKTYDYNLAANQSVDFLDKVFIRGKIQESYSDLHPSFKNEIPESSYVQTFNQATSLVTVTKLEAVKYEYVGGENGEMHIYLSITAQSGSGYFRVKLAGNHNGYQIFGFGTVDALPSEPLYGGKLGVFEKGKITRES